MTFSERFLRSLPPIALSGRHVKRYHINAADTEIEPAVQHAVQQLLPELLPKPDGIATASFTVLHRGRDGAFLNTYNWVWDNVLEFRARAAGVPEIGCPDNDPTHFVDLGKPWIGCVWELATLEHERSAWIRHMLQPDQPVLPAYLSDILRAGPTGNPTC
ncbi:MAG: hypothetical protein ACJ72N_20985 [Labedaea sp.]